MIKLKKITFIILICVLVITLFYKCYATSIAVTKENLNASLQKFVTSDANENNYKITVSDKVITITIDGENYILNYDLTNQPTFSLEIPIQKGMTYAEFKNQTGKMILPMIGYIAVANIQGVEIEDANAYFLMSYLGNALNGSWSSENSYVIVDDTNGSNVNKNERDSKTIYASEFGERVMEYVNATYQDKQTIKDATNGVNSYEWITERKNVTETSCKLVSSLSVNMDGNFSSIKGYANQMGESSTNQDNSSNKPSEDKKGENQSQTQQKNGTSKDDTTTKGKLPQTGVSIAIYFVILFSFILLLVAFGIKLKKYKDIK